MAKIKMLVGWLVRNRSRIAGSALIAGATVGVFCGWIATEEGVVLAAFGFGLLEYSSLSARQLEYVRDLAAAVEKAGEAYRVGGVKDAVKEGVHVLGPKLVEEIEQEAPVHG